MLINSFVAKVELRNKQGSRKLDVVVLSPKTLTHSALYASVQREYPEYVIFDWEITPSAVLVIE